MSELTQRASVRRVQAALDAAGGGESVIELAETARTAEDAANALGCPLGAIVKSLVFMIDGTPVMALVAGDRRCEVAALASALGLTGKAKRADADQVRQATGFSIGGVAPVGHPAPIAMAIDASLGRFDAVYAAAGHTHCVFKTTVESLAAMTGAAVVNGISS